jgi:hypothetical protein
MSGTILLLVILATTQTGGNVAVSHDNAVAFMERARGFANLYAKKKGLKMRRELPRIVMCKDADEVERLTGINARAVTHYQRGTVYLVEDATPDVLLHEAGHWFLNLECIEADEFKEFADNRDERAEKHLRRMLNGNR